MVVLSDSCSSEAIADILIHVLELCTHAVTHTYLPDIHIHTLQVHGTCTHTSIHTHTHISQRHTCTHNRHTAHPHTHSHIYVLGARALNLSDPTWESDSEALANTKGYILPSLKFLYKHKRGLKSVESSTRQLSWTLISICLAQHGTEHFFLQTFRGFAPLTAPVWVWNSSLLWHTNSIVW